MYRPVIVRPVAESDIQETYEYLENARAGLGGQFASYLQEAFDSIESVPEAFATVWQDVRAVRLRKFRYVVYYVVLIDRVEVLAVIHGARHESTWQSRLN